MQITIVEFRNSREGMEDDEIMARELERLQGLQDDLFLDDVGGDKPDRRSHLKKHSGWSTSRVGKFVSLRGRGRARSRMKWVAPGRGRGLRFNKSTSGGKDEEDFLEMDPEDLDPNDLDVLDSWDIEQEDVEDVSDDFLLEEPSLRHASARRGRGALSRGAFAKRGMLKRGAKSPVVSRKSKASKQMLHLEELQNMHDNFDIESKPRHQQGRSSYDGSWPSGYSRDERNRRGEFEDEKGESYMSSRKDARREGKRASDSPSRSGSRTKQLDMAASEMPDGLYGAGRMASQHLLYDAARKDSRLGSGKQRDASLEDGEQGRDQGRRGEHRARSQSPGSRGQNRSPVHGRLHEHMARRGDLSPSPAWRSPSQRWSHSSLERRHERSLSPRERRDRSSSPRHNRNRNQWDSFPREHNRGFSPRRERKEYSTSPRPGRSRTPLSPAHRSSSQDDSWRSSSHAGRMPSQSQYPPVQSSQQPSPFNAMPPPHPQPMYTEASAQGNYPTSAPQSSTYSAPPAPAAPAATTETPAYAMQPYNYENYYQQPASYSRDYPPPAQPPPGWTEQRMVYPDMGQVPPVLPPGTGAQPPPPATSAPHPGAVDPKSEEAKKEAIKNEMMQQKQTLSKQREEYVCKAKIISRELQLLKEQEEDLLQEKSKDNERILKENHKLQLEIQNKLKAINNVIDMLTGIIGDHKDVDSKGTNKPEKKRPKTPPDTPPRTSSSGSPTSLGRRGAHEKSGAHGDKYDAKDTGVFNYVYYDPELHWCRVCNVFPRTAKEYLNHLHSANHKREILERKLVDFPWHKIQADQEVPPIKGARSKRTPIRGLQFFISATAWYCKLCDVWIGDLHCASLHLKSKRHADNYSQYTEKNPHWEADWLADREKAFENKGYMKEEDQDLLPPGVEQPETKPQPMPGYKNDTFFEMHPGMKEQRMHQKPKKKKKKEAKKKNKSSAVEMKLKKKRNDFQLGQESSSSSGSSSSSSSDSSSSDSEGNNAVGNGDKSKSIRVTMRNKAKVLQPALGTFVKAPRSKWDSPERLEEEANNAREREAKEKEQRRNQYERMKELQKKIEREEKKPKSFGPKGGSTVEDRLLREWMTTSKDVPDGEKQLINSLKDRLKQKQEADKEREREGRREGRGYYESKGYYDDRRDNRRGSKRRSESPGSPHKTKKPRGGDRHDSTSKTTGRKSSPRKESTTSKAETKVKEGSKKAPEKKSENDKKGSAKVNLEADDDSAEAKFEKQAAESAKLTKKAKKNPVMSIPKSKLPFIGRMPILKHFAKKKEPEKGDGKAQEEDKKATAEDSAVLAQYRLEFTNVGGKVHIGPTATKRKSRFDQLPEGIVTAPAIGPKLPPNIVKPTTLGEINLAEPTPTSQEQQQANSKQEGVQDMDIDDDTSSDPGAPVIESETPVVSTPVVSTPVVSTPVASAPVVSTAVVPSEPVAEPKKQADEIPLPKDFQEALDILFPGPDGPERKDDDDDAAANISQSAVIESGPKPPSNMQMMQMGHPGQWGDPQMGHPQMMQPQMGGYGGQQMGPSMMGPMHGMPGPPNMQHPAHMQGPHPRMYGPGPPGMQGPPQWGPRGPSGPAGPPRPPPAQPRPPGVPGPPGSNPCMHMPRPQMHGEPRPPPPMPKEPQGPPSPVAPKAVVKKSSAGQNMSAEDLALLGIDAEDMAAQSF